MGQHLSELADRAIALQAVYTQSPCAANIPVLRQAIALYEKVVAACPESPPTQLLASTQCNLAGAYVQLPDGNPSESLLRAIGCCEAALRFYNKEAHPEAWASTLSNLGSAYMNLAAGDSGGNLQRAADYHRETLSVWTEAKFPVEWAETQLNLGMTYGAMRGDSRGDNLREAIAHYEAAFRVLTERESPESWALAWHNLGTAYGELSIFDARLSPRERVAHNRRSIQCLATALQVYTEHAHPVDWALTQRNLGISFANAAGEGRLENLQQAIACYHAALRIYTQREFPVEWAAVQDSLGSAYRNLPAATPTENLRTAIACHQAALEVYNQQDFPAEWAGTLTNLGSAFRDLHSGDRARNVQQAIACYEAALQVRNETHHRADWARTQNNLGTAYTELPVGDRAQNLLLAIRSYEAAHRVQTEQDFPAEWAGVQNNLGNAYRELVLNEKSGDLQRAIACYQAALRVYTKQDFPVEWAMTHYNLGTSWGDRQMGNRTEDLREAIRCYRAALQIYTQSEFPADWAGIQNNLGAVYAELPGKNHSRNLLKAISYYEAALRVRTEEACPYQWATTMDNLGAAYAELQTGDRTENLMRAVTAFMAALRARTPEMAPEDCGKTLDSLGVAQSFRKDWAGVVDTTQRWLALAERRRGSALDRAARQRVGDELWRPLVRGVIAANRLQRFDLALQFSTYGKARTLANHMARRDARPRHMDPQEWTSYQDLLHKQGMLEREYRRELAAPHDERSNAGQLEALEQLQSLSARLKKMEGRFSELDPDYAPFAMPVRIEDWCEIAAMSRSVLVDFQVTPKGSYLSMVGPEERTPGCQCMVLPKLTSTRLRKFVAEWVSEYYLRRTPWAEFLDSFCRGLYERILSPLHRRLRKRYPQATRLVLLPNLGLKLLPLHAAWYQVADGSRRYFGDDYQISYAPSIGVLDRCLKRRQTQSASCGRLVALQSPRLAFAAWEVNAAGRYFDTTKTRRIGPRNIHKRDVMEAIQQASHLLFTTHAIFAPGDADDSALELNGPDEEYLTAREIVNLDLRRTQLAVLSACETGVSDIRDCSDEYLGLASAFLIAGVQTVIASQWPVDDLATALLMHRLFENLYDRGMGNAEALRAAQQWLRALTRKELGELHRHFAGIPGGADRRGFAGSDPTDWFAGDDPTEQLFANPFYWAPFYSFGAP